MRRLRFLTLVLLGLAGVAVATPLGRDVAYHLVPLPWTGEADRLAAVLELGPGAHIADIGAGNGALIVELARVIQPGGRAYATELTAGQRRDIASRAESAGADVVVLEARERASNLPDRCCDAISMRTVWHHLADPQAFADDLRRAIRPGGRVAIIDFAPGAMPHLPHDHGAAPDDIVGAFHAAGFDLLLRDDDWGGRSFLLVFGPSARAREAAAVP